MRGPVPRRRGVAPSAALVSGARRSSQGTIHTTCYCETAVLAKAAAASASLASLERTVMSTVPRAGHTCKWHMHTCEYGQCTGHTHTCTCCNVRMEQGGTQMRMGIQRAMVCNRMARVDETRQKRDDSTLCLRTSNRGARREKTRQSLRKRAHAAPNNRQAFSTDLAQRNRNPARRNGAFAPTLSIAAARHGAAKLLQPARPFTSTRTTQFIFATPVLNTKPRSPTAHPPYSAPNRRRRPRRAVPRRCPPPCAG